MFFLIMGGIFAILVGYFCYKIMKDSMPLSRKISWISCFLVMAGLVCYMSITSYKDEQIRLANQKAEWEIHPEIFWVRCHGADKAFMERGQLWVFYTDGPCEPRHFVAQRNDTLYFTEGILPILLCK